MIRARNATGTLKKALDVWIRKPSPASAFMNSDDRTHDGERNCDLEASEDERDSVGQSDAPEFAQLRCLAGPAELQKLGRDRHQPGRDRDHEREECNQRRDSDTRQLIRPEQDRSRVDLPQPDGPTTVQ